MYNALYALQQIRVTRLTGVLKCSKYAEQTQFNMYNALYALQQIRVTRLTGVLKCSKYAEHEVINVLSFPSNTRKINKETTFTYDNIMVIKIQN
jgi:ABC-type uncharacterized transport system YnjBCD permease subunit